MKKLEAWLTKREINVDLATVQKAELAALLHRFYGELKSEKNGKAVKSKHARRDQVRDPKRPAESTLGSSTYRTIRFLPRPIACLRLNAGFMRNVGTPARNIRLRYPMET